MTSRQKHELVDHIRKEWDRPVAAEVIAASKAIAAEFGDACVGVIFYGSCLRTGEIEDKILDFYVIVDEYRNAYKKRWLAVANKVLPPNVFYHEMNVGGLIVRSKYAVLSIADLTFRVSPQCLNVSVWARFCQPCMVLLPKTEAISIQLATCVARAVTTMLHNLLDLRPDLRSPREVWVEAFEQTYASELRSEKRGKGLEIYLLDQERYDILTPYAYGAMDVVDEVPRFDKQPGRPQALRPRLIWMARRWNGKVVSFLRLIKASVTFDGGIDYLAWKIRRHSGVTIEVTDWMRRHPVLAGVGLFWKLRRKGAFK